MGGDLTLYATPKINILQIGLGFVGGCILTAVGFFVFKNTTIKDDYNNKKQKIKEQWVEVKNQSRKKYNEINPQA